MSFQRLLTAFTLTAVAVTAAGAQRPARPDVLFRDVRVFDGRSDRLSEPTDVLVRDGVIADIGRGLAAGAGARIVEGRRRTLMPGLIDVHVHLVFSAMTMIEMLDPDLTPARIDSVVSGEAERMLLRGFTSVRDLGGPIFSVKAAIDAGRVAGPRIWPSGATISQTSGHGDLRLPTERSRRFFGEASRAERLGASFIADGRDEVLTAVRENLRYGASQIKLNAGGGTSSDFDPVDVTQYTFDELKAAVEAAEDWGTYVTVHAYTPRAVRRAVEAGVKSIEHGQLLDEATLRFMAERGVWLSTQNLEPNNPGMPAARAAKREVVLEGQRQMWAKAKASGVRIALGTDMLFEPSRTDEQNRLLADLKEHFSPAEVMRILTSGNAELLALSGPRSPYQGTLGVVERGALADLLLVDGDPLRDLEVIADAARRFVVIMKGGRIHKDLTR